MWRGGRVGNDRINILNYPIQDVVDIRPTDYVNREQNQNSIFTTASGSHGFRIFQTGRGEANLSFKSHLNVPSQSPCPCPSPSKFNIVSKETDRLMDRIIWQDFGQNLHEN